MRRSSLIAPAFPHPSYCELAGLLLHLYNCSWRLLGERRPHRGDPYRDDAAGTLYWEDANTWHTFDHVIVSGSLLTEAVPFLDESSLGAPVGRMVWGNDGKPLKFDWRGGRPVGLSDHLPIRGRIVLQREKSDAKL